MTTEKGDRAETGAAVIADSEVPDFYLIGTLAELSYGQEFASSDSGRPEE